MRKEDIKINRILICSLSDKMGGAEQVLKMIATYYLKIGYSIDIFFLTKSTGKLWDDFEGENINKYYTQYSSESKGIFSLIRNILTKGVKNYDYAFTSHVHCTALVGFLYRLKLINIKNFVARESTSIFKRFTGFKLFTYKSMYKLGYSPVDLLICQTDYMKDQLIEGLPWLAKKVKIRTIPNPIDLANIDKKLEEVIENIPSFPYIVSAGRLMNEKGYDILIKAFSKLKINYPQLNLIILGDGKQRESLTNLIESLNLQEDVHLLGFQKNVYPFFKKAQMCVVSSRIEGFPNVLLQMMSQNTKVVSTKCAGGISEIQGIYTCETEDIDALYNTMDRCLKDNTEINRSLFDMELKRRSIGEFVKTIENYLNE